MDKDVERILNIMDTFALKSVIIYSKEDHSINPDEFIEKCKVAGIKGNWKHRRKKVLTKIE